MLENVDPGARLNGDALEQLVSLNQRSPTFRRGIDRLCRLALGEEKDGYSSSTGQLHEYEWRELKKKRWHKHVDRYMTSCETLAYRRFRLGPPPPRSGRPTEFSLAPRVHKLIRTRLAGEDTYRVDVAGIPAGRPAWTGGVASQIAAHLTGNAGFGSGTIAHREAFQRQGRTLAHEYEAALVAYLATLDAAERKT